MKHSVTCINNLEYDGAKRYCDCGGCLKLQYCCRHPNLQLFQDTNLGGVTVVAFCSACQKIAAELLVVDQEEEDYDYPSFYEPEEE